MKTLHITLKKKWFDMTLSGEKQEEYRIIKPYWIKRLCDKYPNDFKNFDCVKAKNGYAKDSPVWCRKFLGIEIREGNLDWGAVAGEKYFVIKLGDFLNS